MKNLDSEEKLYLAMHAIGNGQHDIAIERLKDIQEGPFYNRAQYLLAAEYAQIGMHERAKQGFAYVCEAEPTLTIAAFQKGLLHMTLRENDEAKKTLDILTSLEESDPLRHFSRGLVAMLDGEKELAKKYLHDGIKNNATNPSLNKDMQKVLNKLTDPLSGDTAEEDVSSSNDAAASYLLSKYGTN